MRTAILCPGLSLRGADCDQIRRCQVVVGVNRAVLWWPCDFWVVRDLHTFLDMDEREKAGLRRAVPRTIVTSLTAYGQICRNWPAAERCSHIDPANLELPKRDGVGRRVPWPLFSSTTAIALAAELAGKTTGQRPLGGQRPVAPADGKPRNLILCYGMDWQGAEDWDGHSSDKNCRTEERWKKEERIFGQMQDLLVASGSALSRVTVAQSPAEAVEAGA